MNRRRLRPPDDVQRDGLVGVAAETFDFEVMVAGVERIAEGRGRLRWTLVAQHALVPGDICQTVGFLARFLGTLRRSADRTAVDGLSGFGRHCHMMCRQ